MTHMAQVLSNRPAIPMVLLLGFHTALAPNRYINSRTEGRRRLRSIYAGLAQLVERQFRNL